MNIFANKIPKKLKVLEDDEIRLELSLGIPKSLQYYYLIYDKNNNNIGQCGIRLQDNIEYQYLGNIEYRIFEQYRGNNYAEKASRLLCEVAFYYNASKVLITADPSNTASNKTIQNLGTRFIEVRRVPANIKLHRTSKYVNVYEWDIKKER